MNTIARLLLSVARGGGASNTSRFAIAAVITLFVIVMTVRAGKLTAQPVAAAAALAYSIPPTTSALSLAGPPTLFGDALGIEIQPRALRAQWWAPAASLIIPGAGQALLGQQRSVAYLAAEGFLLVQFFGAQRDVSAGIRDYQSIAVNAARRSFGGSFPKGPWVYYEEMENENFTASGVFDAIPGGEVNPETDVNTFNGFSWQLARQTFWTDPAVEPARESAQYQRAIDFYLKRAVRDEFRWSWRDAGLQRDAYRQAIAATNRSNQRKTNVLTALGANHLASVIDAYVTVRIRRYGGAGIARLKVDGIETSFSHYGDPADGRRIVSTSIRLVARE